MSVLYKHIIQVENKNVGLKEGGGHKHTIAPLSKGYVLSCQWYDAYKRILARVVHVAGAGFLSLNGPLP